jgi:mono/diheme cytochrome c family protein
MGSSERSASVANRNAAAAPEFRGGRAFPAAASGTRSLFLARKKPAPAAIAQLMRMIRIAPAALFAVLLAACGDGGYPAPGGAGKGPTPAAASGAKEANELFQSLCFTCHGLTGHGDGPGAAALDPKPRSFADAAWQDSVTDEQIRKTIVFGGAAVGKSPMMPAQPQLKGKTEVLEALTRIVRGFRAK